MTLKISIIVISLLRFVDVSWAQDLTIKQLSNPVRGDMTNEAFAPISTFDSYEFYPLVHSFARLTHSKRKDQVTVGLKFLFNQVRAVEKLMDGRMGVNGRRKRNKSAENYATENLRGLVSAISHISKRYRNIAISLLDRLALRVDHASLLQDIYINLSDAYTIFGAKRAAAKQGAKFFNGVLGVGGAYWEGQERSVANDFVRALRAIRKSPRGSRPRVTAGILAWTLSKFDQKGGASLRYEVRNWKLKTGQHLKVRNPPYFDNQLLATKRGVRAKPRVISHEDRRTIIPRNQRRVRRLKPTTKLRR